MLLGLKFFDENQEVIMAGCSVHYLKIRDRNPKDHRVATSTHSFGHCETAEPGKLSVLTLELHFIILMMV